MCTPQAHPSAARMFAAVLQRADGAHTLLPFLLEPLRYTVLALSVNVRRRHAKNLHVFVSVLAEIAAGAASGATSWVSIDASIRASVLSNSADMALLVADAASPFVTAEDVMTAVKALDALMSTLCVLAHVEAATKAASTDEDPDSAPQPPPFLPHVHATWPFFVSAITGGRDVACRRAFEHIAHIALLCGGDFLRDRFRNDLWPPMARHLRPAAGFRTRTAVLQFIAKVASDDRSRDALRAVAMPVATSVAELLTQDAALGKDESDIASHALDSLSSLDGDGVFLLQWRLGRVKLPSPPKVQHPHASAPLFR